MEILPYLWVSYYDDDNVIDLINKQKIKNIIHLSTKRNFFKKKDCEEIRTDCDYKEDDSIENRNNILYRCLFSITDYIHHKLNDTEKVLLIGDLHKQDIDVILTAYLIRFGKVTIHESIESLKTKKENIFHPKCYFYIALNKFYNYLYVS